MNTYEHDYAKRRSSKRRILDLLSDGKPHTMRELNAITFRYGGRIHELRKEGYCIETKAIAPDQYQYTLIPRGQMHLL
jgi:hypothetical protein